MIYDITWRRITKFDNLDEESIEHICTKLDVRTLIARMIKVTKRGEKLEIISIKPNKSC